MYSCLYFWHPSSTLFHSLNPFSYTLPPSIIEACCNPNPVYQNPIPTKKLQSARAPPQNHVPRRRSTVRYSVRDPAIQDCRVFCSRYHYSTFGISKELGSYNCIDDGSRSSEWENQWLQEGEVSRSIHTLGRSQADDAHNRSRSSCSRERWS